MYQDKIAQKNTVRLVTEWFHEHNIETKHFDLPSRNFCILELGL